MVTVEKERGKNKHNSLCLCLAGNEAGGKAAIKGERKLLSQVKERGTQGQTVRKLQVVQVEVAQ